MISDTISPKVYVMPVTQPTIPLARPARSVAKRLLDLALASVMLVCSAPVWLAIALAIKWEDKGPVFFSQRRWGAQGRQFEVLKFRTMVPDSIARFGITAAREKDSRITRVGGLLRKMGLDELPQILSIWKGDMSFVGPRALAVGEVIKNIDGRYASYEEVPGFYARLGVRPGLTSIATIYIPKDSSPRRKFAYDRHYINTWSVWKDFKLVVLSFWISFSGGWEKRTRKF
jgi:lipopolysaccharide/colanic/teichoic acid biosynthesis glycosyltransferase